MLKQQEEEGDLKDISFSLLVENIRRKLLTTLWLVKNDVLTNSTFNTSSLHKTQLFLALFNLLEHIQQMAFS